MSTTRKTQKGHWEVENMQNTLKKVLSKAMSIRESALAYDVKKSTLARGVGNKNKIATGTVKQLGRWLPAFPQEYETELDQHVLDLESRFFGLTCVDLRRLAYDFAEKINVSINSIKTRRWQAESGLVGS